MPWISFSPDFCSRMAARMESPIFDSWLIVSRNPALMPSTCRKGGFEGGFRFGLVSAVGGAVGSVVCFAVGGWMCLHGCCWGGLFRLGRRLVRMLP